MSSTPFLRVIRGEPLAAPPMSAVARFLAEHPLFAGFTAEQIAWTAQRVRVFELQPGEALIEQGAKSRCIAILAKGQVGIVRDHHGVMLPLAMLETGDVCSEISLLGDMPAVATATASDRSVAIEIPAAALAEIGREHPQLVASLQALACQRLEELKAIAESTQSYSEGRVALV